MYILLNVFRIFTRFHNIERNNDPAHVQGFLRFESKSQHTKNCEVWNQFHVNSHTNRNLQNIAPPFPFSRPIIKPMKIADIFYKFWIVSSQQTH